MKLNIYTPDINDDDGADFLRDEREDWVASGRKEEAELEALEDYGQEE